MKRQKIAVVGGGLAGLMATQKIVEMGMDVDLISIVKVKRSHSVCAQGGINGACNTKGEDDSPWEHFDDTLYGGDFLANQKQVWGMCEKAPEILHLFDRMGVMFNRTPEGHLDFRRFGGTKHRRTAFAGATTGQQLLYALDEQVRKFEAEGRVRKFEGWDFVSAIIDDEGICRGITAQEMISMKIHSFKADAVIMASGGPGMIFGRSTNSLINTGAAAGKLYQQGAIYANGEFIQIHPTAIPGDDKLRLMSESARGEGARVWTYKDGKPWYFLEEKYPSYGNLVPRDIATREIFDVCVNQKLGIDGENKVFLDVSHIDSEKLNVRLGGILEIYEKFMGDDPRKLPMKIFPGVHYSMGGLWVDDRQQTNIPGLFAAGECDYSQHGANRLGANSLLSAVYGGMVAGPKAVEYVQNNLKSTDSIDERVFSSQLAADEAELTSILSMNKGENVYNLHQEMGELMTENVTVVRENKHLAETDKKLTELMERYKNLNVQDTVKYHNHAVSFIRGLSGMMDLAKVITQGAERRNESRGAHYKPDYPERNDEEWLKTTMASYNTKTREPDFSYADVDTSLIKPRKRDYTQSKKAGVKS
ncbi:succinate dehydrogenase flavoprotein subunit [Salisediminibacterium halotolerans]|uniref:succinate dehydrogenase n=1 Tax=Salisediminibacterium halotolerans TaxID=517425 RepID=A0A1H9SVQ6_9BACI|nr:MULTISPECIES: succinate dehydrogenase flavoprotein subunit [Salisediminibacterium]RLJ72225.1 succinate dehydrogenase subunit A [Actinophytocola xinjiangensis]RPE85438.1 succinate dehydrogenase subunit A [Salisediminibacterium halotolerans]TWG33395.1 succinate dehydrogenase subunit A [Salisediminibacterium halotolerans]SER88904.1 succinate dehydrogenase / fumarate reductase flavoprotein subunit [Salisediminibacterium haloalkalitolerans]GEL07883.1 succinate dehydrogenase flavoprotein subunit 